MATDYDVDPMPRPPRNTPGGLVYHVLNRANGKLKIFQKEADFLAFEKVLVQAHQRVPIRILSWCVMPNHWHFVLWPKHDGEVSQFMRWLTLTHAQRWKHAHNTVGWGHLYQGRFKSFPIEQDDHLLTALRYVERNAVAAGLIKHAQDWRWGSCHVRQTRSHELRSLLSDWPVDRPNDWLDIVNLPLTEVETEMIESCIAHGRPLGEVRWMNRMVRMLHLAQSLRPIGRPKGSGKVKPGTEIKTK